jgi:predicted HicB family RNase H-like nuclease
MGMVRPTKPQGEARDKLMQIRLQEREYAEFQEAAARAGKDLSEWVRQTLARAAKRQKP